VLAALIQRLERLAEARGLGKWAARGAVFITILFPVLLTAAFSYNETKQELTSAALTRKQAVAGLSALTLKERFDRLVDIAVSAASNGTFVALAGEGRWSDALAALQSVPKDFPFIERVFVTDSAGTMMADVPALPGITGKSFAHRDWYRGVSKDWKPYISEAYKRQADPPLNVIAVAAPVRSNAGAVHGVLVLQVKLDTLLEWATQIDAGPDAIVYFVDRNGHVAAHPQFPPQGKIVNLAQFLPVPTLFDHARGVKVLFGRELVAYEPLAGYDWGVIVQQPTRAAFFLRDNALRSILFFYGLIVVFTAMLAVFVLFAFESVNSHRNEKQRAEDGLRQAHTELETRVQQRTQELATANESLQQEITERRNAEQQLLRNAFYDMLTGLPNRALFMERLGQSLRRSQRRQHYKFAVLFLDIDRFKVINDSLGHIAGDRLLVATAQRLAQLIRAADTVARFGGDEFALLLDDIQDVADATHAAERIQKEIVRSFTLDGQEVFITASVGIALSEKGYDKPEHLLRDADMAMYRAKSQGKARYEIFNMEMHARAMHELQLEADLWRAVEHEEFRLYYQPVVSLRDGRPIGYEALVRWFHPRFGLLAPSTFISLAEDTGLIVQIGKWVLRHACQQNKIWQANGLPPLEVSVNISARQFRQRDLAEMIGGLLEETGLEPHWLNLEITESTVMENVRDSIRTLRQLKDLGVHLAIDDFGTGYSSLGYLKRFPFDALKIDQSFIRDIDTDPDNASITIAMITLAHNLKLKVVAEGVETQEQLAFLVAHECDQMQGYLFSRPVAAEHFAQTIQEGRMLQLPNGGVV